MEILFSNFPLKTILFFAQCQCGKRADLHSYVFKQTEKCNVNKTKKHQSFSWRFAFLKYWTVLIAKENPTAFRKSLAHKAGKSLQSLGEQHLFVFILVNMI